MDPIVPTAPAPSAGPVPAAPAPAAPPAPAPSAAAADPTNLAYYSRLASESLLAGGALSTEPSGTIESPVPAPSPAPAAPVAPAPGTVQTPEPPAPAPAAAPTDPDEAEPPAEVQAQWTDGERTLHGVVVKERAKRKEARAELATLRQELADLKTKLPATPETPPAAPAPVPVLETGSLAQCHTPEAVDLAVATAVATETKALRWQNTLARQGEAAKPEIVAKLTAEGVTAIGTTPLADASVDQLTDYLLSVYEGTRLLSAQAAPRKQYLQEQGRSMLEAFKLVPGLQDPKSAATKRFVEIVNGTQGIKQMGAGWPMLVAKFMLGEESAARTASTATATNPPAVPAAPAPAVPAPAPTPTRQQPGAPRSSVAALPLPPGEEAGIKARIANGTATIEDCKRMASLAVGRTMAPG